MKVGIIGLGVGERHLAAYQSIPGVTVTAICDKDEKHLKEVGARRNVKTLYTDWKRITEDPDIEAVSICTFDHDHAEHTISALTHGKHVMTEKPMANTTEQADDVFTAWRKSERLLTSNLILRCSPRFAEIHRRVTTGKMGDIYYMEGDYIHNAEEKVVLGWRGAMPYYSAIHGAAIHLIDLLRWISKSDVVEVCAMGGNKVTAPRGFRFDDLDVILMRFADGTIAKVLATLTPNHPKFHALRIFGTEATFINQLGDGLWYSDPQSAEPDPVKEAYPGMDKGSLIPDFIQAIREKRQPLVSASDVFSLTQICLAADQSRHQNKFIKVKSKSWEQESPAK